MSSGKQRDDKRRDKSDGGESCYHSMTLTRSAMRIACLLCCVP